MADFKVFFPTLTTLFHLWLNDYDVFKTMSMCACPLVLFKRVCLKPANLRFWFSLRNLITSMSFGDLPYSFPLCLSTGASPDTFDVSQSPDVTVTEGKTVTINCCCTKEFSRGRVKWMINQTEIKEMVFKNNPQGSQNSCSTLTFTNIKLEATGRYICSVTVDLPRLIIVKGNGTVITVTARPDHNTTEGKRQNTNSSTVLYLWTDMYTGLDLCRKQRLCITRNRICKIYVTIPLLTTGKRIGAVITDTARENTDVNTDHHVAGDKTTVA